MRFSIIIPTYNRRDTLRQCLGAAVAQDYPDYETIVVSDASPDGTGGMVRESFPQVVYLEQAKNGGPAGARNRGIAQSNGDILLFTDDDCLLPADFLSQLAAGYGQYPQAAGVGGYLEAPDGLLPHNPYAHYEAYITHHHYRAGRDPYLGGMECPAGGTNSMSYRRTVLQTVGHFDQSFPVPGGEDTDLKKRVVAAGYQILYIPVKVVHLRPYTFRNFWQQYHTHGRGVVPYERKHNGRPPSPGRVLLRFGVRFLRWFPDLVRLRPTLATLKLLAGWADAAGQWRELGNESAEFLTHNS